MEKMATISANRLEKILVNILYLFCFFPFLKVIPGSAAEVQPIGVIFAFILFALFGLRKNGFSILILFMVLLLFCYSLVSYSRGIASGTIIMALVSYCAPLFIFLGLVKRTELLSPKILIASILIYLFVGVLQSMGHLEFIAGYFNRASWLSDNEGRGVPFLTPEPANAGWMLALMWASTYFFYLRGDYSQKTFLVLVFLVLWMVFLNKSATIMMMLIIFWGAYFMLKLLRTSPIKSLFLILFLFLMFKISMTLLPFLVIKFGDKIRFLGIFKYALEESMLGQTFHLDFYNALVFLGGKRFLTVIIGFVSLWDGMGLGHGLAGYVLDFERLSRLAGVNWVSYLALDLGSTYAEWLKPDSYASALALDTGLLGVILIILLLCYVWFCKEREGINKWRKTPAFGLFRFALFALAAFMILFNSTAALPVPWVILAYIESMPRKLDLLDNILIKGNS